MKFTEEELLLLWGKTCRDKDDPEASLKYHPLLFHFLDVGNCAEGIWDCFLPQPLRERIAKGLGIAIWEARAVVTFLAAVHDLGKASPGFQFQDTQLDWLREDLVAVGLVPPPFFEGKPHNFISTKELCKFWRKFARGWEVERRSVARILAHITGAHHGTFPDEMEYGGWGLMVLGDESWDAARLAIFETVQRTIWPNNEVPPALKQINDPGMVPILAGLISVADWVGSAYFEPCGAKGHVPSLDDYSEISRKRAKESLLACGFVTAPKVPSYQPAFKEFWGFKPNSLQETVSLLTHSVDGQFLLICESSMGSGKTEGSLWMADAALGSGNHHGLFVGLPTQATSNPMHRRVGDYLKKRLPKDPIHLQLVHGNAGLSDAVKVVFDGLRPVYDDLEANPETARVVALSWFTGAKRPLLAPFGVGTIDQSLYGVLQTKHWFVRLFGLAGKVVILDEIHSYDCYMSDLLFALLHWLKELGCSVILLSATLPSSKRKELVAAWGSRLPEEEAPYPRLTLCPDDSLMARSIPIPTKDEPLKTIRLKTLKRVELARELRTKLANGGCAAVICNTVNEAQELFTELKRELRDMSWDEFVLFHARMPFVWRKQREELILRRFGKKKCFRPKRALVISTQVLEQSIDCDFDWMASYLAPSDLMLQRLGRLHRHALDENEKPVKRHSLDVPEFIILCEAEGNGPPKFGSSEYVYQPEILLKSWLFWRALTKLTLPGDIEGLIENTYVRPVAAPDAEWEKALRDAKEKAEKDSQAALEKAGNVMVPLRNAAGRNLTPGEIASAPNRNLKDDEDPNTHPQLRASTRDGNPSVTAICLCKVAGRHYLPNGDGQADLSREIRLEEEPDRQKSQALMEYSVPISQPQIFSELVSRPVPLGWKKSPFLRHARPLVFVDGEVKVAGITIRLDGELGLDWRKEEQDGAG